MNNYVEKIRRGDSLVDFHDVELRETVNNIKGELSTDTTTIEGNPLNFTTLSAQTAKSTILSLEPIQDLHGYPNPWVGGVGKNLIDSSHGVLRQYTSDPTALRWGYEPITLGAGTYTVTYTKKNSYDLYLVYTDTWESVNLLPTGTSFTITENREVFVRSALSTGNTESQFLAAFSNVQLEKGNQATTYEPYENLCPISGRTEIGILGCGVNENDTSKLAILFNSNNTRIRQNLSIFRVKKGDKVTISFNNNNLQAAFLISSSVQTDLTRFPTTQYPDSDSGWQNSGYTYTCNYDGWISLGYRKIDNSTISVQDIIDANVQIELGSQPTQYTAYQSSNSLTIAFGQTVYGGTLDVENGVLVVDKEIYTLGNLTWTYDSTWKRFISQDLYALTYKDTARAQYLQSSDYEVLYHGEAISNIWNGKMYSGPSSNTGLMNLFVHDLRYTNTSDFLTAMGSSQVAYPLKDSYKTTINLTPNTIALLKGVNNISVDDANATITLTYRDGSVATLGDLTSAVDSLDGKIDESKILTDTATGDKYILVVTNGVLSIEQISN